MLPKGDVAIRAQFPFRPFNGYIVMTEDGHGLEPLRGKVLAVCEDLEGKVRVGDLVAYPSGIKMTYLDFSAKAVLVNIKDLYGIWDTGRLNDIAQAEVVDFKRVNPIIYEGETR